MNPRGVRAKPNRALSTAWVRGASKRIPATRRPFMCWGWQTVSNASTPAAASRVRVWASSSRWQAANPTWARSGRLGSRLRIPKSAVSLTVSSVRTARFSLKYCLMRECL